MYPSLTPLSLFCLRCNFSVFLLFSVFLFTSFSLSLFLSASVNFFPPPSARKSPFLVPVSSLSLRLQKGIYFTTHHCRIACSGSLFTRMFQRQRAGSIVGDRGTRTIKEMSMLAGFVLTGLSEHRACFLRFLGLPDHFRLAVQGLLFSVVNECCARPGNPRVGKNSEHFISPESTHSVV